MPLVTPTQIANYAAAAGFSGTDLAIAVAIALAESSGNTTATHKNNNGSVDYGLWQINSVHSDLLNASWSNGAANARMAYAIYSAAGNRFTDWVTYNSGAYTLYMPQAVVGAAAVKTFTDNTDADATTAALVGAWFRSQLIYANRADVKVPQIHVPKEWQTNFTHTYTLSDGGKVTITTKDGTGQLSWKEKTLHNQPLIATFTYDSNGVTSGLLTVPNMPSVTDVITAGLSGAIPAIGGAVAIKNGYDWISTHLLQVALMVGGAVCILLGIVLMAKGELSK